jgi:Ca2+/Na+ antiporter
MRPFVMSGSHVAHFGAAGIVARQSFVRALSRISRPLIVRWRLEMQKMMTILACVTLTALTATSAFAECSGSNGRGWGSGKGNGAFEISAADTT